MLAGHIAMSQAPDFNIDYIANLARLALRNAPAQRENMISVPKVVE